MQYPIELIGLMSGTSLDGLDVAHVRFNLRFGRYKFDLLNSETFALPEWMRQRILNIEKESSLSIFELQQKISVFHAECVNALVKKNKIDKSQIFAIASHGQTVYHQPEKGFTVQLGCGSTLAHLTQLKVIDNFRALDIAAGGQGAPLVPLGDKLLFSDNADASLNIGGFSNISFEKNDTMFAFDIGPGNLPLNYFAQKLNQPYDDGGKLAQSGTVNQELLSKLNSLPYYSLSGPKSLGTEWLQNHFMTLIPNEMDPKDALCTISHHIAAQIQDILQKHRLKKVLITGGGAHNHYLISLIKENAKNEIILPSSKIIDFKEAIIFAFLGLRFLEKKFNSISSVTGANQSVCGGALHYPN